MGVREGLRGVGTAVLGGFTQLQLAAFAEDFSWRVHFIFIVAFFTAA